MIRVRNALEAESRKLREASASRKKRRVDDSQVKGHEGSGPEDENGGNEGPSSDPLTSNALHVSHIRLQHAMDLAEKVDMALHRRPPFRFPAGFDAFPEAWRRVFPMYKGGRRLRLLSTSPMPSSEM